MPVTFQPSFVKAIIGRTITKVIEVDVGDGGIWPALRLDNGSLLLIQCDPEGNGGGFMALEDKNGTPLGCAG